MKIDRLCVNNYRNLAPQTYEPCAGINLIYGENAQGKTNLLEAMWMSTGLKSFRGAKDSELVAFGAKRAKIELDFTTLKRSQSIVLQIQNRRTAQLNGVQLDSCSALLGSVRAVVFSPSFLSVIQNGPNERRRFTDAAICQLYPNYGSLLVQYTRIIKQRNNLLKSIPSVTESVPLLDTLDEQASGIGEEIIRRRKEYLNALKPLAGEIYKGLSGGREEFAFTYSAPVGVGEGISLQELFLKHRKQDILLKTTGVGPHRDDISILLNAVNARLYGSQGQQRSCALALKLGEAALIKQITGEEPVILLDDVMSELDALRQDYILNHIKERQVFITCCEPSQVLRMLSGKTVNVIKGRIESRC